MDYLAILIWAGGFEAVPLEWGFLKSLLWPYHLGKWLVQRIFTQESHA